MRRRAYIFSQFTGGSKETEKWNKLHWNHVLLTPPDEEYRCFVKRSDTCIQTRPIDPAISETSETTYTSLAVKWRRLGNDGCRAFPKCAIQQNLNHVTKTRKIHYMCTCRERTHKNNAQHSANCWALIIYRLSKKFVSWYWSRSNTDKLGFEVWSYTHQKCTRKALSPKAINVHLISLSRLRFRKQYLTFLLCAWNSI
jgi:hypothetical protein